MMMMEAERLARPSRYGSLSRQRCRHTLAGDSGPDGLNAAWLVALPAAGLWLVTSFWSGKRHDQRTDTKLDPRENNTYHSHEPA
jgi:hypothetical protein